MIVSYFNQALLNTSQKALDLFIVNISKEIDEKFRNLYIRCVYFEGVDLYVGVFQRYTIIPFLCSDDVMDSFSKPISEAIGVGCELIETVLVLDQRF